MRSYVEKKEKDIKTVEEKERKRGEGSTQQERTGERRRGREGQA